MARADTASIVAVKVLVELHQVAPVRVLIPEVHLAVHRPAAVLHQENVAEAAGDIRGDIPKALAAGRGEGIAEIVMEFLQRFDQQEVYRKPDGPPPVRVTAE